MKAADSERSVFLCINSKSVHRWSLLVSLASQRWPNIHKKRTRAEDLRDLSSENDILYRL